MEVDPVASSNDKTREGGLVLDTTGGLVLDTTGGLVLDTTGGLVLDTTGGLVLDTMGRSWEDHLEAGCHQKFPLPLQTTKHVVLGLRFRSWLVFPWWSSVCKSAFAVV